MDGIQHIQTLAGLLAGEALDVVAPCYIKAADGLVYMADATAVNEKCNVIGFTARAIALGEPVTLFGQGTRFKYSDGLLTKNMILYMGATKGCLDDAASVGDSFGLAVAVTTSDILILRTMPALTAAVPGGNTVDSAQIVADAVITSKILNANVTEPKIVPGSAIAGLTGLVTKFTAVDNVIGGVPVVHWIHQAAGVAGGVKSVLLTEKTKIVFAIFIPITTVAAAAAKLVNAAVGDITNAVVTAAAGVIGLPTTIDPTKMDVVAGTNLTVTNTAGATTPELMVIVFGFRVA